MDGSVDFGSRESFGPLEPVGILLEYRRIQVEDSLNKGTIPLSNYTNSTLEPFTRPADIETRDIGTIHLEDDATESTNILLEAGIPHSGIIILNGTDSDSTEAGNPVAMEATFDVSIHHGTGAIVMNGTDSSSTNAGGRFRFELATDDNININYPSV